MSTSVEAHLSAVVGSLIADKERLEATHSAEKTQLVAAHTAETADLKWRLDAVRDAYLSERDFTKQLRSEKAASEEEKKRMSGELARAEDERKRMENELEALREQANSQKNEILRQKCVISSLRIELVQANAAKRDADEALLELRRETSASDAKRARSE